MMEKILGNLQKGLIFVLSAPAGTGKTTLTRMLMSEFSMVTGSVSCTTRAKRKHEIEGVDYHFVSKSLFEEKVKADEFLEYAEVFGHYYGTLKTEIDKKIHEGRHILLVIDTQGALELQKKKIPAVYIFIQPPSLGELRSRLFQRQTEEQSHIEERLAWAQHELKMAEYYDYIIVNDNIHHAYDILRSILIAEEHKMERYHGRIFNK